MVGIPAMNLWDTVIDRLHLYVVSDFKPVHQTHIPKHHVPFGEIDYVCWKTYVLDCLEYASWHVRFALWALVWATHGLGVVRAPVCRGCPCQDPLGCPPMPRQDGIGSRAPTLVVVLCW